MKIQLIYKARSSRTQEEYRIDMSIMQDYCRRNKMCECIISSLLNLQLEEDDADRIIDRCFAELSKLYHPRRCFLFLFCSLQEKLELTHEWCESGTFAQKGKLSDFSISQNPWLNVRLENNEIVEISDSEDLSPEITHVRECLGLQGNLTFIVPIKSRSEVEGFLGIDIIGNNELYSEYKEILHKIADVIGNTLSNQRRTALLESKKKDAERCAQQKTDFANYISHEVRNPLTSIQSIIEVIERSNLDNLQMEYVGILKQAVTSLLWVVNQALEYSRSECGAIVLQEIPFNLKSVITGCFDVYKEKARQKGLSLTYGVSENIPAELIGDPGRLCQIIGNLVDNSIKFTQQGGIDLHVSLEHEDEKDLVLHFDVVDTGIGIPPECIGRLFERFSQVNTPGPCKCKGSGLGLSICKNLVEIMGGRIFAESAPDKGSRFSFLIKFRK